VDGLILKEDREGECCGGRKVRADQDSFGHLCLPVLDRTRVSTGRDSEVTAIAAVFGHHTPPWCGDKGDQQCHWEGQEMPVGLR
jgi:hypothetical protein